MKISPISSTGATIGSISTGADAPQAPVLKPRSLKMNTMATPGVDGVPDPVPEPTLAIPDVNVDPAAAEATQPLSPQLAAIAKQRRALQQERQQLDKEKADYAAAKQDVASVPLAKLKSNALSTLLEAGVTYEQLTQEVLDSQNGHSPEVTELRRQVEELKTSLDKKLADRDTSAEEAALNEMESEAKRLSLSGDDYELVRETNSIKSVRELIKRTYKETGEVLDVREALKLVEDELIIDGLKLANLKKIQSQFAPAQPVLQPQQPQRQMRTLTNRDTASVPLSRKARALAAFHGTLKK